jgi:predicted NBD/HSP70 family sugar kinase
MTSPSPRAGLDEADVAAAAGPGSAQAEQLQAASAPRLQVAFVTLVALANRPQHRVRGPVADRHLRRDAVLARLAARFPLAFRVPEDLFESVAVDDPTQVIEKAPAGHEHAIGVKPARLPDLQVLEGIVPVRRVRPPILVQE